MGTAIALLVMLAGMLLVAGHARPHARARRSLDRRRGSAPRRSGSSRTGARAFFAFLHPWHDAQGTGFQIVQAMIGIGSGHIFGVGLGQGVQKIFYLPEAHTDMIFANIGEELGLVGIDRASSPPTRLFGYAGLRIALAARGPVRQAPRERADGARLRPGGDQHRGRARASRR